MKKTWNSPEVQELTIQATAWWGGGHGYGGNGYGGGHGHGGSNGGSYGGGFGGGKGDSNTCRCQGGTSPCEFHHFEENFES